MNITDAYAKFQREFSSICSRVRDCPALSDETKGEWGQGLLVIAQTAGYSVEAVEIGALDEKDAVDGIKLALECLKEYNDNIDNIILAQSHELLGKGKVAFA